MVSRSSSILASDYSGQRGPVDRDGKRLGRLQGTFLRSAANTFGRARCHPDRAGLDRRHASAGTVVADGAHESIATGERIADA
jgi:hypothetical protein